MTLHLYQRPWPFNFYRWHFVRMNKWLPVSYCRTKYLGRVNFVTKQQPIFLIYVQDTVFITSGFDIICLCDTDLLGDEGLLINTHFSQGNTSCVYTLYTIFFSLFVNLCKAWKAQNLTDFHMAISKSLFNNSYDV